MIKSVKKEDGMVNDGEWVDNEEKLKVMESELDEIIKNIME